MPFPPIETNLYKEGFISQGSFATHVPPADRKAFRKSFGCDAFKPIIFLQELGFPEIHLARVKRCDAVSVEVCNICQSSVRIPVERIDVIGIAYRKPSPLA